MKKSDTLARKQSLDIYPADHIPTGAETVAADPCQDLTQLVWKYFAEEITEALREVQEALAPEESGSVQAASGRKG
jgi:hypothetical protein